MGVLQNREKLHLAEWNRGDWERDRIFLQFGDFVIWVCGKIYYCDFGFAPWIFCFFCLVVAHLSLSLSLSLSLCENANWVKTNPNPKNPAYPPPYLNPQPPPLQTYPLSNLRSAITTTSANHNHHLSNKTQIQKNPTNPPWHHHISTHNHHLP